jgi:hypothetical protein
MTENKLTFIDKFFVNMYVPFSYYFMMLILNFQSFLIYLFDKVFKRYSKLDIVYFWVIDVPLLLFIYTIILLPCWIHPIQFFKDIKSAGFD